MDLFKLDLSLSATRKTIFGSLVVPLDEVQRSKVAQVVSDSSVPAKAHLHNFDEVKSAINSTVASAWAKEQACAIYLILAQAEAYVHGCSLEETHFHEVGEGMTVRELLGMCTALDCLGRPSVQATSVQVGSGTVTCSHGVLDIPAPATDAILKEYKIPIASQKLDGELCTPTSAAFIAHFVHDFV